MTFNPADSVAVEGIVRAAMGGDMEILSAYIKDGGDPDLRSEHGTPLLHEAAFCGQYDAALLLLDAGANPNLTGGPVNYTALHFAASRGGLEVTRLLLSRGADPNASNGDTIEFKHLPTHETPLHTAANKGSPDVVAALIEGGSDIFRRNSLGQWPRDVARERGALAVREHRDASGWQEIDGLFREAEAGWAERQRREKVARDLDALKSYNPGRFKFRL